MFFLGGLSLSFFLVFFFGGRAPISKAADGGIDLFFFGGQLLTFPPPSLSSVFLLIGISTDVFFLRTRRGDTNGWTGCFFLIFGDDACREFTFRVPVGPTVELRVLLPAARISSFVPARRTVDIGAAFPNETPAVLLLLADLVLLSLLLLDESNDGYRLRGPGDFDLGRLREATLAVDTGGSLFVLVGVFGENDRSFCLDVGVDIGGGGGTTGSSDCSCFCLCQGAEGFFAVGWCLFCLLGDENGMNLAFGTLGLFEVGLIVLWFLSGPGLRERPPVHVVLTLR